MSPLGQVVREQTCFNFIAMATWPPSQSDNLTSWHGTTWCSSLTPCGATWSSSLTPWHGAASSKQIIFNWNLCKSHQWLGLMSNGNVQHKYLFPKTDGALWSWESSRVDLSVPLESQHNKFCCLFSTAVQLITPVTQNTHCFCSAIFTSVYAQLGTH